MTPTSKLRWVKRVEQISDSIGKRVLVLQQWWECEPQWIDGVFSAGEWRDIPVETKE